MAGWICRTQGAGSTVSCCGRVGRIEGRWLSGSVDGDGDAGGDGLCSGVAACRMEAVDGEDDGDAVGEKAGQLAVPSCGLLMGWRDGSSGGGMVAAGSWMWVADRI
ncbi:hypothetical protein ACLOJK_028383 [Asimina triloba]